MDIILTVKTTSNKTYISSKISEEVFLEKYVEGISDIQNIKVFSIILQDNTIEYFNPVNIDSINIKQIKD